MKLTAILFLASLVTASPTVYFIRHGEKPEEGNGLNAEGQQRAQCLRSVFGASSQYNIGHIMAQTYKSSGARKRPYDTVLPLAQDLGLTVDTSCDRDDSECVKDFVKNYEGTGNILICWEHKRLNNLAQELGADDVDNYPSDRFDIIWTDPPKYKEITEVTSENCPGLDA
ncbi:hypothetical protein CDV31_010369 [Fusarium ambrosium]|uniref:Phosphoglycerate mutase family protein n=1 Tax=Fusarium ambrosium TaxID=131363 RepID=A0A428TNW0_9HYPO|nr:hypothetical protein CDV31_010369 [Fusarium ambrosium]